MLNVIISLVPAALIGIWGAISAPSSTGRRSKVGKSKASGANGGGATAAPRNKAKPRLTGQALAIRQYQQAKKAGKATKAMLRKAYPHLYKAIQAKRKKSQS